MSLWTILKRQLAPPPIASLDDLRQFLESRAAYLAQKSIMEYSQARAPMAFSTLLSERGFLNAYEHARWVSYPIAFSMVAMAVEAALRPLAGGEAERLRSAIEALGRQVFDAFPLPSRMEPAFWRHAADRLSRDLAASSLAEPKSAHRLAVAGAPEILEVLPVHSTLREGSFEMFRATLQLHLTEILTEFEERADAPRLVREALDKP